MNPVLADIYSTILPSAPFVIAAYALLWVALLVFVLAIMRGIKKSEAQVAVLEEALEDLKEKQRERRCEERFPGRHWQGCFSWGLPLGDLLRGRAPPFGARPATMLLLGVVRALPAYGGDVGGVG